MAFDDDALDASKESAGVFGVVKVALEVAEGGEGGGGEAVEDEARNAFGGFEEDIAGEAVGDEDVDVAVEDRGPFDVAGKVRGVFQGLVGELEFGGAFDGLGADVEEADAGVGDAAGDLVGKAELGVLDEVFGFCLEVGADVENGDGIFSGGHEGEEGGAEDAGLGGKDGFRRGDESSGVASGDEGVDFLFFEETYPNGEGGVPFAADRLERGLIHSDGLGGDLIREVGSFEFRRADAEEFDAFG